MTKQQGHGSTHWDAEVKKGGTLHGHAFKTNQMVDTKNQNGTPFSKSEISTLLPEVGAVWGSASRTDLYGGCRVTGIPTVTCDVRPCDV